MGRYIFRRFRQSLLVLAGLVIVVFFVTRQIGDPAMFMLPLDASEEQYRTLRRELGLDDPLIVQFGRYLADLLRGDFGTSLWQHVPAMDLVLAYFPATVLLAVVAILVSTIIGVPLGVLAALRPGSAMDRIVTALSIFGMSVPGFWLALMFIYVFSIQFGWFSTSGYGNAENLIMPVMALAAQSVGVIMQISRTSMLGVLNAQYLVTARSKGLRASSITTGHALRNALLPIVTVIGDELVGLLAGTVVIEVIFAWPGIGKLMVDAIRLRDYEVTQAVVIFVAVMVITVNLAIDLLYALLDPRIRYS